MSDTMREAEDGKRALQFLEMQGYRRCNIPACNCPFWHGGNASDRLSEIHEVLSEAGCEPHRKTAIKAIEELIAAQADARALVGEMEKALRDSEQLLQDAQDIMRSNIIPNGVSNKDAIAAYIALLDNTRQRTVQTATHQALTKAQAFMDGKL